MPCLMLTLDLLTAAPKFPLCNTRRMKTQASQIEVMSFITTITRQRLWTSIISAAFPSQSRTQPLRMGSTTTPSAQAHPHPPQRIFFGPFDVTNQVHPPPNSLPHTTPQHHNTTPPPPPPKLTPPSQVFLTTPHSFALVNLKPLLPGHVLVCPLRRHQRLTDLSPAEVTDLFTAVQRVQRMLARHYFSPSASPPSAAPDDAAPDAGTQPGAQGAGVDDPYLGAFNIALQDGPLAGQTVPHVHVHIIPRIAGATGKPPSTPSDAVYDQMAGEEGNVGGALWDRSMRDVVMRERPVPGGGFPRIEDAARVGRTEAEMEGEAGVYRRVLEGMGEV